MAIVYSADHPLGYSGSVRTATGSGATLIPLVTTEGLPSIPQDDHIYAVLTSLTGAVELVKVTDVDTALHNVTVERGAFGSPILLEQAPASTWPTTGARWSRPSSCTGAAGARRAA